MIICTANQKGGVGKTSTSVVLSCFFSYIKKQRVLLIDVDPQGNATSALFNYKNNPTMLDVVTQKLPLKDAICKSSVDDNLDIIPASQDPLTMLQSYLFNEEDGPLRFADIIEESKITESYDVIIWDTPPDLGRLTVSALVASDYVLVPTQSTFFAAEGFRQLNKTVAKVRNRLNPHLQMLGVFINQHEGRATVSRDIVASYKDNLGDMLLHTCVRRNITIEESLGLKRNLFTYAPKSNGAQDFAKLGDEILMRLIQKGELLNCE